MSQAIVKLTETDLFKLTPIAEEYFGKYLFGGLLLDRAIFKIANFAITEKLTNDKTLKEGQIIDLDNYKTVKEYFNHIKERWEPLNQTYWECETRAILYNKNYKY